MLGILLLTFLLASILYLQLQSVTRDRNVKKDLDSSKTQQLKSAPRFSIVLTYIRILISGNGGLVQLLYHIGQRYKICQSNFFGKRILLINDIKLGREAFTKSTISGRPPADMISFYAQGDHGIVFASGEQWRQHRKFAYQHLKQFGFNTHLMEKHAQEEVNDFIQSWRDRQGKTFSPNKAFYLPLLSTLWTILAGERASTLNQNLIQLVFNLYSSIANATKLPEMFVVFLPLKVMNLIATWIPFFPGVLELQQSFRNIQAYLNEEVKSKIALMNEGEHDKNIPPRNLIDAYLKEIQASDLSPGFQGQEGALNLATVMIDFFVAGGDTTAGMLNWCMLHLIRNPQVQEKIVDELKAAVGENRRPLLSDRINCPYIQCFIWEAVRFSTFSPGGLPHEATEDTNIGPYFVKKGTIVFLNIYGIHHDPRIWGDPENFRPERFLSPDRKNCIKHEALCGFAVGQRRCLGEQLALDNMFLFVSNICLNFVLKTDPMEKELPSTENVNSLFNAPHVFNMVAVAR